MAHRVLITIAFFVVVGFVGYIQSSATLPSAALPASRELTPDDLAAIFGADECDNPGPPCPNFFVDPFGVECFFDMEDMFGVDNECQKQGCVGSGTCESPTRQFKNDWH